MNTDIRVAGFCKQATVWSKLVAKLCYDICLSLWHAEFWIQTRRIRRRCLTEFSSSTWNQTSESDKFSPGRRCARLARVCLIVKKDTKDSIKAYIGYPLLAAEHSPCKAPWSGTPCPTTSAHSRTMSPLDSTWKPG